MTRTPIAVWKSTLLPRSETFLRTQGESLTRYESNYFGLTDAHGLELPDERTFLLGERGRLGGAEAAVFKLTGRAPTLTRRMRERRVALVHAHFGTEAWRGLQLGRELGIPTVATFHGADATTSDAVLRQTSSSGRQYVRHRRRIFHEMARCIAVSDYIAGRLVDAGCPEEKVIVHRVGVNSAWFSPPDNVVRDVGLLFVGRLVEKKGLLPLFEALVLLREITGHVPRLSIAGEGPQRSDLENEVRRLGLDVDFLGYRDHEDVRALMHRMTALVVPSQDAATGESEGLPTVIREAQASGLPVVVTRTAGAAEVVNDAIDGLLVPPNDAGAMARTLGRLFSDVVLQETLRRNALSSAALADTSHQATALESLYDDVLKQATR